MWQDCSVHVSRREARATANSVTSPAHCPHPLQKSTLIDETPHLGAGENLRVEVHCSPTAARFKFQEVVGRLHAVHIGGCGRMRVHGDGAIRWYSDGSYAKKRSRSQEEAQAYTFNCALQHKHVGLVQTVCAVGHLARQRHCTTLRLPLGLHRGVWVISAEGRFQLPRTVLTDPRSGEVLVCSDSRPAGKREVCGLVG